MVCVSIRLKRSRGAKLPSMIAAMARLRCATQLRYRLICINSLFMPVVAGNGVCVDPLEEIERGKATVDDCCHGSSPLRNKATLRIKHRRTSTLKAEQSSSMLTVSWHGVALRSALSDLFHCLIEG